MPIGSSAVIPTIAVSMAAPSSRMSPPSRIEMPSAIARWPLTCSSGCGGSTKPRRTVAMSPSRIVRPPAISETSRMSASVSKAPETRRERFSSPVLITPEGRTTFCAAMAAKIWP